MFPSTAPLQAPGQLPPNINFHLPQHALAAAHAVAPHQQVLLSSPAQSTDGVPPWRTHQAPVAGPGPESAMHHQYDPCSDAPQNEAQHAQQVPQPADPQSGAAWERSGRSRGRSRSRSRGRSESRSRGISRGRSRGRSYSRSRSRSRERRRGDGGRRERRRDSSRGSSPGSSRDRRRHHSRGYDERDRGGEGSDEDRRRGYGYHRDRGPEAPTTTTGHGGDHQPAFDAAHRQSRGRRTPSDSGDDDDDWRRRRSSHSKPSSTVFIRGIPEDKDETDLWSLFNGFPNVKAIRLQRDRGTGKSRGFAFVDFESEEDARVLLETKARYSLQMDGRRLIADYTQYIPPALGAAAAGGTAAPGMALDWVCDRCSAVNFARRLECYLCCNVRPTNPQRVSIESDGPTSILKLSNVDVAVREDALVRLFMPHGVVRDVRLVRDKYTGAPRGFAFVEFASAADAAKAMAATLGAVPEGCTLPLRMCFARDRAAVAGSANSAATDALEAAQAMQQYSSWEPKAFQEAEAQAEAEAPPVQQPGGDAAAQQQDGAKQDAAAAAAGGSAGSGFTYDSTTGYWYDQASGYYYDANTALYYHPSAQSWYAYDHATGEYTAVGTGGTRGTSQEKEPQQQQVAEGTTNAARSTIAAAEAAVSAARASAASAAASRPAAAAAPERKRGAVIGAAPKLNPQGLLAAAALAEEREAQKKREEAALRRQQHLQQAQKQKASGQAAPQPAAPPASPAPTAPATAAVIATGNMQGVVYKSKWAQRQQQQQQ